VRYVDDAKTLKALSDPLRLAILNLLMYRTSGPLKALTVKELAAELGQPQTKLYRHVKQLQGAGLIEVAETRVVSGNVEHRYRSGQLSLRIDEAFLTGAAPVDDALGALDALWNRHHKELFAALRADHLRPDHPGRADRIKPTMYALDAAIPRSQAQEFTRRLTALAQEFIGIESDPSGIPINILIAYCTGGGNEH
jgi:DNA-binding transcriptional ArsR family regulator